mgnify:CR=1 FL=1
MGNSPSAKETMAPGTTTSSASRTRALRKRYVNTQKCEVYRQFERCINGCINANKDCLILRADIDVHNIPLNNDLQEDVSTMTKDFVLMVCVLDDNVVERKRNHTYLNAVTNATINRIRFIHQHKRHFFKTVCFITNIGLLFGKPTRTYTDIISSVSACVASLDDPRPSITYMTGDMPTTCPLNVNVVLNVPLEVYCLPRHVKRVVRTANRPVDVKEIRLYEPTSMVGIKDFKRGLLSVKSPVLRIDYCRTEEVDGKYPDDHPQLDRVLRDLVSVAAEKPELHTISITVRLEAYKSGSFNENGRETVYVPGGRHGRDIAPLLMVSTLRHLSLDNLRCREVDELLASSQSACCLETLHITVQTKQFYPRGETAARGIAVFVATNKTVLKMCIDPIHESDSQFGALAVAIQKNHTLISLGNILRYRDAHQEFWHRRREIVEDDDLKTRVLEQSACVKAAVAYNRRRYIFYRELALLAVSTRVVGVTFLRDSIVQLLPIIDALDPYLSLDLGSPSTSMSSSSSSSSTSSSSASSSSSSSSSLTTLDAPASSSSTRSLTFLHPNYRLVSRWSNSRYIASFTPDSNRPSVSSSSNTTVKTRKRRHLAS